MTTARQSPRARNARGEGAKLRLEIVAAAGRLLDAAGSPDAVTLRAVAREIGVAAPSIYAHFPDRDAIVHALIEEGYAEVVAEITTARDTETDPVKQLEAGVRAYLRYALDNPARYTVMLGRPGSPDPEPRRGVDDPATISFQLLVTAINNCVREGLSNSADSHRSATAIMVAIHGYAIMRPQRPTFPWPPEDGFITYLVTTLADIESPGS
jgi:AcrR family transcriptional regulator